LPALISGFLQNVPGIEPDPATKLFAPTAGHEIHVCASAYALITTNNTKNGGLRW
jgi:hypothetical protein